MPFRSDQPKLDDTIRLLTRLVGFATISADSNREMIDFAANYLEEAGARIHLWESPDGEKANLFASIGPDTAGGIVLSGHSDVVPVDGQDWTSDPFRLTEREGRLFGRGACDMKGFIAAAMAMAGDFAASALDRPLHIALTYDEETGCLGGQQLVLDMAAAGLQPSTCIVGEPTGMRVIEGHKGCYEYTTRFTGLAAHGSLTHIGVNAVEYACRYANRLMAVREELKNSPPEGRRFEPPYTTVQIGRIAGGVSRNTIAGDCEIEWEMRPVRPADAAHVKRAMESFVGDELLPAMRERAPKADIETETIGEVAGLAPTSQSEAREICTALTGNDQCDVVSFGTEAGLYQEMGISAIVCGPGSIEQAHKPDEFIEIAELARCIDMLEGLKARLSR